MARTQSEGGGLNAADGPRLLLVCLGNPGPDYAGTRHNAGWLFADYLFERHGLSPFEAADGFDALLSEGELAGAAAVLVKPTNSMNESGAVVAPLAERWSGPECLFAIAHDDLDVPLGSVKGRQKGGHGGHNGVRAVLAAAGDTEFFRVKIGVGSARKRDYDSVAGFLLSEFEPEERAQFEASLPQAEEVLVGQFRSFLAGLARRRTRRDAAATWREEALDEARAALERIGAASPYPVLLSRRQVGRLFEVVTALAKLLRKARRAAGEDDAFYERLVGFVPEGLLPLLPPRSASERIFFAADLHVDGPRVKLIELNCAVGYGHYADLAHEALFPLVRDRLGEAERPVEGDFATFLYLRGLGPLHDPEAGALAFLRGFGDEDMFNVDEVEGVAARIEREFGLCVPLCHERDLKPRHDGLYLEDGRRVGLLYVEENLSEWAEVAGDSPIRGAVRDGLVATFPPLDHFLYTSKGFPAVLADPAAQRLLSPDEAESKVLRENVLWSAPLDGRIEPACYHMLGQGLTLVVKDALGGGGRGVTVLRPDSSSQQTGHILRRRMLDGRSVVQGYFEAGRWGESDLRFDVRVLCAADESDIVVGPVYGRIFRGEKLSLSEPDCGVAPVYVLG
jgi:PTH1 family peptidyl-tRNA hydrolase